MILPILISVSVAPGSYFFSALAAALASAAARSPAKAADLTWLKTRWCIIVLPDVLAEGSCSLDCGAAWSEPSDRMRDQYARLGRGCQCRLGCYFPQHGRKRVSRFRFRDAPVRAITVKQGARGATMMAALRMKACSPCIL